MQNKQFRSIKWIVDNSFISRQPKYCKLLIDLFGNECIRSIKTHAKFLVIQNEKFNFVVRTSMNLNGNPRIENFEITESEDFANYFVQFTNNIFENNPPSLNFKEGSHNLRDIKPFNQLGLWDFAENFEKPNTFLTSDF